jgi:hypothetical protein
VQQRAQDAAHVRIVVANEESQLVEVDAEHGAALGTPAPAGIRLLTYRDHG